MIENFNLAHVEHKYNHTTWVKALRKGSGPNFDLLKKVIMDAEANRESETKGGRYYSAARFIANFYKNGTYKFKKCKIFLITCCKAYPNICDGYCCNDGPNMCQCDIVCKLDSYEHLDNCYGDCCDIFKFAKRRRYFKLAWYNSEC